MTRVAVLGSPVRLIVLRFWMRSDLVPAFIPRLPINSSGVFPTIQGEEVLPPTRRTSLSNFVLDLLKPHSGYKLVDTRVAREKVHTKFARNRLPVDIKTSDVRFTFCHEQFLDQSEPVNENFSSHYSQFVQELVTLATSNLWLTQGHWNPYFEDGEPVQQTSVLFLNSTDRTPLFENGKDVLVHQDGREKINGWSTGIGPKVPLVSTANKLEIIRNSSKDKEVQLV